MYHRGTAGRLRCTTEHALTPQTKVSGIASYRCVTRSLTSHTYTGHTAGATLRQSLGGMAVKYDDSRTDVRGTSRCRCVLILLCRSPAPPPSLRSREGRG